jgi:hypothetical protein
MMQFVRSRDEEEIEVPVLIHRRENNPVWPAYTTPNTTIFLGGNAYGIVARQD